MALNIPRMRTTDTH